MVDDVAITVALLGNPNTGKSTLFQALTGVQQRTGNFPGVTVEKKVGRMRAFGKDWNIIDLPGTYSLAPRSPDEMITVDVLLGRRTDVPTPQLVVCIVDATNLQRNLFLVSQILDLQTPVVIALNMTDLAEQQAISIDVDELAKRIGVAVVPIQAHRKKRLDALKDAMARAIQSTARAPIHVFPAEFHDEARALMRLDHGHPDLHSEFLAERLLLDTSGYLAGALSATSATQLAESVAQARLRLSKQGLAIPAVEAISRYRWISDTLQGIVHRTETIQPSLTDRLDRWLTHRFWGLAIFALLMLLMFQAVFSWAEPLMGAIEHSVTTIGAFIARGFHDGPLRSLFTDGIVAGVGSVLVFLPQIVILFFFIALLEDCGYMARAAYLMDRPMSRLGLSGRSFIPLLSSFACAIPGIMATRVIDHRRDRLVTILVAPLMSCSARLPVYVLLIETFVPDRPILGRLLGLQGLVMFSAYLVGIIVAAVVVLILKRTIFRGEPAPFVLELPTYKIPSPRIVLSRMFERGWSFVRRAGTLILAVAILVWAAAYFPRAKLPANPADTDSITAADVLAAPSQLRQSYLGRLGQWIEPVVRPLGWDWRIGCAVLASFPAREVVIGAMGVIYNLEDEADETSSALRARIKSVTWEGTERPVYNLAVAMSLLVFFALCAQCAATLVIIYRETNSWRWPLFTFVYMTTLAYFGAWITYRLGIWAGWG